MSKPKTAEQHHEAFAQYVEASNGKKTVKRLAANYFMAANKQGPSLCPSIQELIDRYTQDNQ